MVSEFRLEAVLPSYSHFVCQSPPANPLCTGTNSTADVWPNRDWTPIFSHLGHWPRFGQTSAVEFVPVFQKKIGLAYWTVTSRKIRPDIELTTNHTESEYVKSYGIQKTPWPLVYYIFIFLESRNRHSKESEMEGDGGQWPKEWQGSKIT